MGSNGGVVLACCSGVDVIIMVDAELASGRNQCLMGGVIGAAVGERGALNERVAAGVLALALGGECLRLKRWRGLTLKHLDEVLVSSDSSESAEHLKTDS